MDLADSYCEQRLKKVCEDLIKRSVTIDNVSRLLAAAVKYNATVSILFPRSYYLEMTFFGPGSIDISAEAYVEEFH